MKFSFLVFLVSFSTLVLGCGGGGGAIILGEDEETFDIPDTGAILSGDGIFSSGSTDPFHVEQSLILSGGNSGTFTGSSNGVTLTGSYVFTHVSGASVGTLVLTYNASGNFIESGQMSMPITFAEVNPVTGVYQNASATARLFTVGGTTSTTTFISIGSNLEGIITFLD